MSTMTPYDHTRLQLDECRRRYDEQYKKSDDVQQQLIEANAIQESYEIYEKERLELIDLGEQYNQMQRLCVRLSEGKRTHAGKTNGTNATIKWQEGQIRSELEESSRRYREQWQKTEDKREGMIGTNARHQSHKVYEKERLMTVRLGHQLDQMQELYRMVMNEEPPDNVAETNTTQQMHEEQLNNDSAKRKAPMQSKQEIDEYDIGKRLSEMREKLDEMTKNYKDGSDECHQEMQKTADLKQQLSEIGKDVDQFGQKYKKILDVYSEEKEKTAELKQQLDQMHQHYKNQTEHALNDSEEMNVNASRERESKRMKTSRKVEKVADSSYEAKLRSDIVASDEIDVTLDDIGSLEKTKKLIQELVILPVKRPEFFKGGSLLKPCKGILLFGPPGTGKTMLAKAIAKECQANFISVSLASIFCMWIGESEKNVKALFTLAAKVAPTIIFVDEVDSLLGRRTSDAYDTAYRKVKNEFMSLWDGLRTKAGKQILVLGATNRPFDLDEAIVRRFERRIFVDLPCENSRKSILEKILSKENVENMNFKELASMTEGYSGSDLKNLCTTAGYQPLREFLERERLDTMGENQNSTEKSFLRPLNMNDIKEARKQVRASFSADGASMLELKKWNDSYGEGGSRTK